MSESRGAVLPLLALTGASCLIAVLLLGATLRRVAARAECQHAADAAALAGVAEGREAAERLAAANGAVVATFAEQDNTVEVWVACGEVRAAANAERGLRATDND